MRLIDADNFINNLRLLLNKTTLGETSPHESISVGEIATLIKNEPTAYDVDKVVEQLEENSFVPGDWIGVSETKIILAEKAKGIVKSGGIE